MSGSAARQNYRPSRRKHKRAAYFAVYDLGGGPLSQALISKLEQAVEDVVKAHGDRTVAILATVE